MVPTTLEEWNFDEIKEILKKGVLDSERFDFKEKLPITVDLNGNPKLQKR